MVEVFKTDVNNCDDANRLVKLIHETFSNYQANFDLDDCDLILRIATAAEEITALPIISLLKQCGFQAEVLQDNVQPFWFETFQSNSTTH